MDWNKRASEFADGRAQELFKNHVGTEPANQLGVTFLYGNIGYGDERGKICVELVRQRLSDEAVEELGFGTDNDGYSWVMVINSDDREWLFNIATEAYGIAFHDRGNRHWVEFKKAQDLREEGDL